MTLTSFDTVDGYGYVDLDAAPAVVGPVRCARKVLHRTTIDLARHVTYAMAFHRLDVAGGAAALNFDRTNGTESPIEAFATELGSWSESVGFRSYGGLGLGDDEVGDLIVRPAGASIDELVVQSAVAAAGPFDGPVIIASSDDEETLLSALGTAGATDVSVERDLAKALEAGAATTFVRGATGILDHESLAEVDPTRIVGLQPLTTTARGLAFATRRDAVVVPDFVSAAGPYLAAAGVDDVGAATADAMKRIADTGPSFFVAACELAESHLQTWTDDLPFGRPLAA